jgi:hypothetical protein
MERIIIGSEDFRREHLIECNGTSNNSLSFDSREGSNGEYLSGEKSI